MIRKIVVLLLSLVIASAALKIFIHLDCRGAFTQHADFRMPDKESQTFVFSGMEMTLPWSRITGVYTHDNTVMFGVDDTKKFIIVRYPAMPVPAVHLHGMRDKIESYFDGNVSQLVSHPESIDRIYVARPGNVTWRSNPFSDVRTAIGLILWRLRGGAPPMEEVENSFMRGYHTDVHRDVNLMISAHTYDLGMKDGTSRVFVMMFEGTEEFVDPILRSVRVVQVTPEFSRQAFERSNKLSRMGAGDSNTQKLALLTAIEAVSNSSPNLEYYSHVLDLYRKSHLSRLAPAWFGSAIHQFPASRSALVARHPEFAQYK